MLMMKNFKIMFYTILIHVDSKSAPLGSIREEGSFSIYQRFAVEFQKSL